MSNGTAFQILRGFLNSLGFVLEEDGPSLWARRVVAGEELKLCFCGARADQTDEVRQAIKLLSRAGRREIGVSTYLITASQLCSELRERAEDAGVTATSEFDYLNLAIQSQRTCTEAVVEAHAYIPEAEYVEQRIMPEDQQASQYLANWIDSPEGGLLIVLAHAGYGKTCLSYQLARRLARKHLGDPRTPVPFVMPLHRHRHVRRFEELVLTHLQDRGILGFTSKGFAFLANNKRLLPILDGFDELAETGGLRVARDTLKGLIEQLGDKAKVILTSRQAYFRHRGDLSLVGDLDSFLGRLQTRELQPFNQEERRLFLDKRGLDAKSAQEVERAVQGLASEELLASPLMLRILADEVKNGEKLVGSTATEVFERSLTRVCEREVQKQKIPWPPAKQMSHLAAIADLMNVELSYELVDSDSWLSVVVDADVSTDIPQAQRREEVIARVTQLKNHPLLTALTIGEKDAIMFPHPLYRDYFVAAKFKLDSSADFQLRGSLRSDLPDGSVPFLSHMLSDSELAAVVQKSFLWKEGTRDVWKIILGKCDRASSDDRQSRSQTLVACLGGKTRVEYQNLSGLNFRLLEFDSFEFVGVNLTKSSFHACKFRSCRFDGSQLTGCRFYECEADTESAEALEKFGIQTVLIPRVLRGAKVSVTTREEDPVLELVTRFFRRFIREQRGTNQRSARVESFFSGFGGEERKFTDREVIPAMLKAGVMTRREAPFDVYIFNVDWQADGDALIFDNVLSERLTPIIAKLREKAERYNLF